MSLFPCNFFQNFPFKLFKNEYLKHFFSFFLSTPLYFIYKKTTLFLLITIAILMVNDGVGF